MGAISLDSTLRLPCYLGLTKFRAGFAYKFFKRQSDRISGVWEAYEAGDFCSPASV